MKTLLLLLLFGTAPMTRVVAEAIPIPTNPATTEFGPLTIQYPADWAKQNARIGEGITLRSPTPIAVGSRTLKLAVSIGKDANPSKTIAEFKKSLAADLGQEAKKINEASQKVIGKEAARQKVSVQLTDVGVWSLDTETRNGVEILRSTFTGMQAIDRQPFAFRTEGFYHLTANGLYVVTFTYPTSMKTEYEPFVNWLMKQIQVEQ